MNITFLLKQSKKKKKDLAVAANITTNTIRNYENGNSEPSLSTLIKMADFFGVSLDTLVGNSKDIVDLKVLNKDKQKLIKEILNLNPQDTNNVISFIQGMNSKNKV